MPSRRRGYRRTAVVGVAWVGLLAAVAGVGSSASAQDAGAPSPGTGSAYAQGLKVDPAAAV